MTITRHYVRRRGETIHYRAATPEGPPAGLLVALHPSPGSSATLLPMLAEISGHVAVLAPDLPGCGDASALPSEQPSMAEYAAWLGGFLDLLGLRRVVLYGEGSGAAIALAFADAQPDRVAGLALEGLPLLHEVERDELLREGAPSLAPQWDGSHLARAWMMARDSATFHPWFRRTPEDRILRDFPSFETIEQRFVDLLRGAADYAAPIHAALAADPRPALARLAAPTILLVDAPSPAAQADLPAAMARLRAAAPTADVRLRDGADTAIAELAARAGPVALPEQPGSDGDGSALSFTPGPVGPVFIRRGGKAGKRPLVLLHGSPGTSVSLEPWMAAFGSDREVVAFDTPGNGDSAAAPESAEAADLAAILGGAIDALGVGADGFDLYGSHTGALIAMELAIARPLQVRHVILDGVTMFSPEEEAESLAHHAPPVPFSIDGGHVLWIWNYMRDRALWWHWYNRTAEGASAPRVRNPFPSPDVLHKRTLEFLKHAHSYHAVYRAALGYPTRSRLPLLTMPAFLCAGPSDPLRDGLPEAGTLLPSAVVRVLPNTGTLEGRDEAAALFRDFLDR